MEIADIVMKLNKTDTIPKRGVTPAEVVILSHKDKDMGHFVNVGGFPVDKLEKKGEAKIMVWDQLDGVWRTGQKWDPQGGKDEEGNVIGAWVVDTTARTDGEEVVRLTRTYGKQRVEACFPGATPSLPKTFADVSNIGGPACGVKEEKKEEKKEEVKK